MRVLVAAASKHGGTAAIAQAIGAALGEARLVAEVRPIDEVTTLEPYDAIILGSGVYMGRWLPSARSFVRRNSHELETRPVWLFSSGPLGDPPRRADDAVDVAGLVATTHARGHHLFPGVLDKERLSFGERAMVAAVRAPAGDFRPWAEIRTWALDVARSLGHEA